MRRYLVIGVALAALWSIPQAGTARVKVWHHHSAGHAEDVLLFRGVEDAGLALRRNLIDAALRTGTGEYRLAVRVDGQAPNIVVEILLDHLGFALRRDADDCARGSSACVYRAVRGRRQAEDLTVGAGVGDRGFAAGRQLVDFALVPGRHEQVAELVLDNIPDVHRIDMCEGFQLAR